MRILKVALVTAVLSAASGGAAHAQEWRYLARDGHVEVAIDVDSFSGPQTHRTAQSVIVSTEAGDPFGYLIVAATIDCRARTITGVSISAHDQQGLLLDKRDLPPETDSVQEAGGTATLANAACDGVELTGRSFGSADAFAAWVKERPTDQ